MWMWFKESNRYFCKIDDFAYGETNKRSFVIPTPCLVLFRCVPEACNTCRNIHLYSTILAPASMSTSGKQVPIYASANCTTIEIAYVLKRYKWKYHISIRSMTSNQCHQTTVCLSCMPVNNWSLWRRVYQIHNYYRWKMYQSPPPHPHPHPRCAKEP